MISVNTYPSPWTRLKYDQHRLINGIINRLIPDNFVLIKNVINLFAYCFILNTK